MIKEFKEFINRGNVVDLAIAFIMGGSFSLIITSLVNDIVMPIVSLIFGGFDFSTLIIKINGATINIGLFIQNIVNFIIIAFIMFLLVRQINSRKKSEVSDDVLEIDPQVKLLEEIKDLLKK
ncbi:MAG: large conductance mechanosensitive channel protein MscL [Bacilli bacterium]